MKSRHNPVDPGQISRDFRFISPLKVGGANTRIILPALFLFIASLGASEWVISEDFNDLARWDPLVFPKIEKHSTYEIVREDGGNSLLAASSDASASGLIFRESFDIYKTPLITWKWKVDGIISGGNALKKKGDDYALRIYVIFAYDPEKASRMQRLTYNIAKTVYGEYPPDSSLNYVWANRKWKKPFLPNAFTSRALMVAADYGESAAGEWRINEINVLEDYRKFFGKEPPRMASLAIMADTDNTGNSGGGFIDYIRVGR